LIGVIAHQFLHQNKCHNIGDEIADPHSVLSRNTTRGDKGRKESSGKKRRLLIAA
jgi:hypothetical protein